MAQYMTSEPEVLGLIPTIYTQCVHEQENESCFKVLITLTVIYLPLDLVESN